MSVLQYSLVNQNHLLPAVRPTIHVTQHPIQSLKLTIVFRLQVVGKWVFGGSWAELTKVWSMTPEHQRLSPRTLKARNYPKVALSMALYHLRQYFLRKYLNFHFFLSMLLPLFCASPYSINSEPLLVCNWKNRPCCIVQDSGTFLRSVAEGSMGW